MLPLPERLEPILHPVFAALSPQEAMRPLMGASPTEPAALVAVGKAVLAPELHGRPDLAAGLWLYVGDFIHARQAVETDPSPAGAFWSAILHRREGAYEKALYWYGRASHHPAMEAVSLSGGQAGAGTEVAGFDPVEFVGRVRRHVQDVHPPADLLALQHHEWAVLFRWCAENK